MVVITRDNKQFVAFNTFDDRQVGHLYVGQPVNGSSDLLEHVSLIATQGAWGSERNGWHDANIPRTDYPTCEDALTAHGFTL